MSASTTPITGSCLCRKVTYTINLPSFSREHLARNICQCTMCRKQTGALLVPFIAVHPRYIQWNDPAISELIRTRNESEEIQSTNAYKDYKSSADKYRGFCSHCGSTLLWRGEKGSREIEILTGTVDEEVLLGEITSSPDDPIPKRSGGLSKELTVPDLMVYYRNCLPEYAGLFDQAKKHSEMPSSVEIRPEDIQELRNRA